jgi:DNA repair exonuclease SbcCD ATPase subunit
MRCAIVWRHRTSLYLTGLAILSTIAGPALAQEVSREREALRRAQQQFAKLQEENTHLQAENSRLQQLTIDNEKKLKAAVTDATKLRAETERLRKNSTALKAAEEANAVLTAKLGAAEERHNETVRTSKEDIDALQSRLTASRDALATSQRESQQTAATLNESLERETARVAACEVKNAELYGVTSDLINRYKENRGAWEKFLLSEPFTGLKSVEVDNLLQEFRDRASKARVPNTRPPGSVPK